MAAATRPYTPADAVRFGEDYETEVAAAEARATTSTDNAPEG